MIENPVRDKQTLLACAPIALPIWDMFPKRCAGVQAFRSASARDRVLRSAVYPGQLHDRGRRFAQLRHTKKMMYSSPAAWDELMGKLVAVVSEYAAEQVRAGADVIQVFDSWVGCLSVEDYVATCCRAPPNW